MSLNWCNFQNQKLTVPENVGHKYKVTTWYCYHTEWCRSVQVSCWIVHMWMGENYKTNNLTQIDSAVVQISLPVTQSSV